MSPDVDPNFVGVGGLSTELDFVGADNWRDITLEHTVVVLLVAGTLSDRLAGLTRPDTAANLDGVRGRSAEDCFVRVAGVAVVTLFFVGVMGRSAEVLRGLICPDICVGDFDGVGGLV